MLSEAVLITPSDNLFAFKEFAIQKISSQDSIVLVSKLHKGVGVIIHCAHRNTQNCWYAVLLSVESPPDEPYEVIFVNIFTYFNEQTLIAASHHPNLELYQIFKVDLWKPIRVISLDGEMHGVVTTLKERYPRYDFCENVTLFFFLGF